MKNILRRGSFILIGVSLAIALTSLTACVATPSPTPTPTPSPSPEPTPTPTPSPSPEPESVTIDLSAENIAFDKSQITVPAGAMVTIVFTNKDSIPHNFALYQTSAATTSIFVGEIIRGPATIDYTFTAPTVPGDYFFRCDVHPAAMTGTFTVE